jgi:hypothetical protein
MPAEPDSIHSRGELDYLRRAEQLHPAIYLTSLVRDGDNQGLPDGRSPGQTGNDLESLLIIPCRSAPPNQASPRSDWTFGQGSNFLTGMPGGAKASIPCRADGRREGPLGQEARPAFPSTSRYWRGRRAHVRVRSGKLRSVCLHPPERLAHAQLRTRTFIIGCGESATRKCCGQHCTPERPVHLLPFTYTPTVRCRHCEENHPMRLVAPSMRDMHAFARASAPPCCFSASGVGTEVMPPPFGPNRRPSGPRSALPMRCWQRRIGSA